MDLKYLVVGSGAMGGISTAFLTRAGKNVTMIARGENYDVIKKNGLHITTPSEEFQIDVKVSTWEEYNETPDVVMICAKAYSIDSIVTELDKICNEKTLIFTVSNSLDLGSIIEKKMTVKCTIVGGVAYIAVVRDKPGFIRQKLGFYNIVLGMRNNEPVREELYQIQKDFNETGAKVLIRDNPVKSALRKFFRVSVISAVGCYYDTTVGDIRDKPERLELFKELSQELMQIAEAMGDPFGKEDEEPFPGKPVDQEALEAFMQAPAEYKTSMKYDWDNNHQTEIREQILDVIDLGEKFNVPMTAYRKVAKKLIEIKPNQVNEEERAKYGN